MSQLSEMKLYDVFDGTEISELFDLLRMKIDILDHKINNTNDSDFRDLTRERLKQLNCLYEDMAYMWSEMIKDGHWNHIRYKNKFVKGE